MGEIADMMLDGILDCETGEYLGDPCGFPRTAADVWGDKPRASKASKGKPSKQGGKEHQNLKPLRDDLAEQLDLALRYIASTHNERLPALKGCVLTSLAFKGKSETVTLDLDKAVKALWRARQAAATTSKAA